jgi:hypothetical protein
MSYVIGKRRVSRAVLLKSKSFAKQLAALEAESLEDFNMRCWIHATIFLVACSIHVRQRDTS